MFFTDLAPVPPREPSLRLAERLGAADKAINPYFHVPFTVPQGTTRIDLALRYPKSESVVIDLGLGDTELGPFPSPRGHRGWSGGARSEIFLGTDAATPGYVSGPIAPGVWQVILGLYRVRETPVDVEIDIWFSNDPRPVYEPPVPARPKRAVPGWYKGDLQCHTFHSDGQGSPEQLHATARREGLDFLAVTEHNTLTSHPAYFAGASSQDLIFIPAYEFTTEFGHANVFGADRVFDFRSNENRDIAAMVEAIRQSGALFSPNHDKPTIAFSYDVAAIDCMEVWQGHWLAGNFISLARYQERLVRGERVTAIGGSDFHQPHLEALGNPFTLGRPCTFLWLDHLSVEGVLGAMRAGRSFVSESPTGPRLSIGVGEVMMGGTIPDAPAEIEMRVQGARGDIVTLIDATGIIAEVPIASDDFAAHVTLVPKGFVRAEIVAVASRDKILGDLLGFLGDHRPGHSQWDDTAGHPVLRALTSPIYVAPATP